MRRYFPALFIRLMQTYNWQQDDWPHFRYTLKGVEGLLLSFAETLGHVSGMVKGLPDNLKTETLQQHRYPKQLCATPELR